MKNISLKTKISVVIIFSVIALTVTIGSTYVIGEIREMHRDEKRFVAESVKGAAILAYTVAPHMADKNYTFMNNVVDYYGKRAFHTYVAIVDASGRIVARTGSGRLDSFQEAAAGSSKAITVDGALVQKYGVADQESIDISYPVKAGDLLLGRVRIGLNTDWLREQGADLRETIILFLASSAAVIFLGILLSFWITNKTVVPLLLLKEASEKVGKGDYNQRVHSEAHDEVGVLVRSFNKMVDDLRDFRCRVDNDHAELTIANQLLIAEISKRKQMEEEVVKAQRLESLGVFAGGIAHDFNNLLTGILGNIWLAMLDLADDHPVQKSLSGAEHTALRAQNLTRQLLTFSKGGAPVKRTVSIGDIIRESADFTLRGSRCTCAVTVPEDLALVDIDEGQIGQVFHNLLRNADQAMPGGGTITVCCENAVVESGSSTLPGPGKYVKITIRDTGSGIAPEHLARIFDPYFTTKDPGNGLGLATCYSIVQKHGGAITVESSQGAGTVFTILLPASAATAAGPDVRHSQQTRATGKILLMDDEAVIRQSTGDALKTLGYTVDLAEDGQAAIQRYQEALREGKRFDLVIMDLTVRGGMGGQEAMQQLMRIDPSVKAIVSSGYSDDPVMADFRKYGFSGVVVKPYRIEDVSDAVHRVMAISVGRENGTGTAEFTV